MRSLIVATILFWAGAGFAGELGTSLGVQQNPNMVFTKLCGNGHVDPGEACDGQANCKADCSGYMSYSATMCGNGNKDSNEGCDDGNYVLTDDCPTGGVKATCQPAKCGDGLVWEGHEECDGGENCGDDCKLLPLQAVDNPDIPLVNQEPNQGGGANSGNASTEKVFTTDSGARVPTGSQAASDTPAGGCSLTTRIDHSIITNVGRQASALLIH